MEVGPYTYLKLESFPASPELDPFGMGAKRHRKRWMEKMFSREGKDAKAKMKQGECFKKKSKVYCYRAEDRGYVTNNEINQTKLTKYNNERNFLSQDRLSESDKDAIRKYTHDSIIHHGIRRNIYKLRTGQELFVPQQLTNDIVRKLRHSDDAVEIPQRPQLRREHTFTVKEWSEGQKGGGKRTRRRRTRKKRKTRRRRRKRKKRKTRKKKN
jgi:hypothetical protein